MNRNILFLFVVFFSTVCLAQKPKLPPPSPELANEHFSKEQYALALKEYQRLLKESPKDPLYNYRSAVCMLRSNCDKSNADICMENCSQLESSEKEFNHYKARAYQVNYKFDEAIRYYEMYLNNCPEKQKKQVLRNIQNCVNAKDLMQFPLDVTIENLGKLVNSEYSDFLPLLPAGENYIMFTSRRKPMSGEDKSILYSDVYISEVKNGVFAKAKELGPPVNTMFNEEASGLSADGRTLFLNIDNMESSGVNDIFMTTGKGKTFQKPGLMGKNVNGDDSFETSATITPDGNTLIFISDRKGGKGGKDLYFSKKLPTGDWGIPENLTELNSELDEEYPFMTDDGKTIYYASEGFNSMGGFDIFKTTWNDESKRWSEPRNLGYPVNTPNDDWNFVCTRDGREAYISSIRPEGFGDYDIYKVTFNQIDPKYTVFKGFIQGKDSVNIAKEASITINNVRNNNLFGLYTVPASKNGKYIFYLPPGKYEVNVEVDGIKPYKEEIVVMDKKDFKDVITRNLVIEKSEVPKKVPAKNIKKTTAIKKK